MVYPDDAHMGTIDADGVTLKQRQNQLRRRLKSGTSSVKWKSRSERSKTSLADVGEIASEGRAGLPTSTACARATKLSENRKVEMPDIPTGNGGRESDAKHCLFIEERNCS